MRALLVLPTLNEEAGVQGVLEDALRQHEHFDVVVVDGRSEDATVALAQAAVFTCFNSADAARARPSGPPSTSFSLALGTPSR